MFTYPSIYSWQSVLCAALVLVVLLLLVFPLARWMRKRPLRGSAMVLHAYPYFVMLFFVYGVVSAATMQGEIMTVSQFHGSIFYFMMFLAPLMPITNYLISRYMGCGKQSM